jgi:hypothetical protein
MFEARQQNFGACPCSGTFEARRVDVKIKQRIGVIAMYGVRQGECPSCGSRVYHPATLRRLEAAFVEGQQSIRGGEGHE